MDQGVIQQNLMALSRAIKLHDAIGPFIFNC